MMHRLKISWHLSQSRLNEQISSSFIIKEFWDIRKKSCYQSSLYQSRELICSKIYCWVNWNRVWAHHIDSRCVALFDCDSRHLIVLHFIVSKETWIYSSYSDRQMNQIKTRNDLVVFSTHFDRSANAQKNITEFSLSSADWSLRPSNIVNWLKTLKRKRIKLDYL